MYEDLVKAAEGGNTYAMLSLAYCYQKGINFDIDPEEALKWYKLSAAKGCARARWELSKMYRDGILVEPNGYEFIHWLTAAAESGIPEAMNQLAWNYGFGYLLPKDNDMVIMWLQKSADMNYPFSEFILGYLYENGLWVDRDPVLAKEYMDRVSLHGDVDLFFKVGTLLEFGDKLIAPNREMASIWYKRAADMGSSKAYFSYVRNQDAINGGKPDTPEIRKSKISRLPEVLETVQSEILVDEADAYMDMEDYDVALEKYREAADMGNADALLMMSILYHDGDLVKRNKTLAFDYLVRSALRGNTEAQIQLAHSYEVGDGCRKDLNEATNYYAMAIANGNLSVYYQLTKYIEHPETFVNKKHKVVR